MKKIWIVLIVVGELLIFSGVVLGYYHPLAGSIFEIIGGLLNLCFLYCCWYMRRRTKRSKNFQQEMTA